MIKKSYRAVSLAEAVIRIRREMGTKAVIVQTKVHPARKTLFRSVPAEIEVLAAIDEKHLTSQQIEALKKGGIVTDRTLPSLAAQILARAEKKAEPAPEPANRALPEAHRPAVAPETRLLRERISELESENAGLRRRVSELEALTREIRLIEEAVAPAASSRLNTAYSGNEIRDFMGGLSEKGVGWPLLDAWKKRVAGLSPQSGREAILEASVDFFLGGFVPAKTPLPRVCAFVGAEKSGKTSMVMKVAVALKNAGESVAVISLDVTDADAVLAYRELESSHGVPFFPVRQNKSGQRVLDELSECGHVLIDTYSVGERDLAGAKRLNKRLEEMGAECVLVYSGTLGDEREALDTFRHCALKGLIFTGLDTAPKIGRFYNLMHEAALPVHYFGIGAQVPDDVEAATAERLVALLLRLDGEGDAAFPAAKEGAV